MRKLSNLFATVLLVAACKQGVPEVSDPHNVVVDGVKMTQAQFMERYCVEKIGDPTCIKVGHAMRQDSSIGGIPRF